MRLGNKEIPKDHWYHGYRIEIFPTEDQKEFLDRCIDVGRFIYNWCIEQENKQYEIHKNDKSLKSYLSYYELSREFTKIRKELDFVNSIPYHSARNTVKKAYDAFNAFFEGNSNKPKFKSKKKCRTNSYETRYECVYFEDNMLKIEGLKSLIYTKYHSGFDKSYRKFKHCVISRDNMGRYFISYCLEEKMPLDHFDKNNIKPLGRAIGIDLNVKKRFVLSTGEIFRAPDISRELVSLKTKQSRVSRDINRRKKMERTNPSKDCQSKRAKKRLIQLQKQYKRIANIEENFIQTTTKKIINMRPTTIVMEDLNVKEMFKNHNIAKNVYHANFYRCIKVMKCKSAKYGIPFMQAAKDYPSSQLCSKCGNRQEMKLGKSTFKCEKCGFTEDRDVNAALNLEKLAYC